MRDMLHDCGGKRKALKGADVTEPGTQASRCFLPPACCFLLSAYCLLLLVCLLPDKCRHVKIIVAPGRLLRRRKLVRRPGRVPRSGRQRHLPAGGGRGYRSFAAKTGGDYGNL